MITLPSLSQLFRPSRLLSPSSIDTGVIGRSYHLSQGALCCARILFHLALALHKSTVTLPFLHRFLSSQSLSTLTPVSSSSKETRQGRYVKELIRLGVNYDGPLNGAKCTYPLPYLTVLSSYTLSLGISYSHSKPHLIDF